VAHFFPIRVAHFFPIRVAHLFRYYHLRQRKGQIPQGIALQKTCLNFKDITIMIKWNTVKKILQIVATVITTILGTNIIQSCINA
jgi:hypothetical protein